MVHHRALGKRTVSPFSIFKNPTLKHKKAVFSAKLQKNPPCKDEIG